MNWCVAHDAQETPGAFGICWLRAHRPDLLFSTETNMVTKCDLQEVIEEPIYEMDRIAPEAEVPEGWTVQFETGAVKMISRVVSYRRVLPTRSEDG